MLRSRLGLWFRAFRNSDHWDRLASLPIEVLNVSGSDISTTAIEKASEIKGVDFYECDIQHEVLKQEYDIIVMSEVLWYLLENLETSFKKYLEISITPRNSYRQAVLPNNTKLWKRHNKRC